jgi:AraC-like DNA-binding protein
LGRVHQSPVTYRGASSCNGAAAATCLALVAHHDDRLRLRTALNGRVDVEFFAAVADVLHAVRSDRTAVRAVILEAHDANGRPAAGLARQLTHLFPGIPVIGYCSSRTDDSHEVIALASAGVHELLYKQQDDNIAMLAIVLQRAEQACIADVVLRQLDAELPPRIQPFIAYCLANPEHAHAVAPVAAALDVNRKTLFSYCRTAGFPPPSTVIAWCLILTAAGLLATPGVTVAQVAMQLDFPSASALRNMLKRYTGLRPAALRSPRALAELCRRFLDIRTVRTSDA